MLNSIICGATLYALVLISVAIIIPYTDLLGQNHTWATGAVADMAFGRFGGMILAIPVLAGILTGMNGFFMATTRLLFSMGRGKFLHPWFPEGAPQVWHPDQRRAVYPRPDPYRAFLRPLRPQLDRRHVRYGHRARLPFHLPRCLQVRLSLRGPDPRGGASPVAVVGALTSIACFLMLAVPGSPAAIGFESWIMLLAWVAIGACFYFSRAPYCVPSPKRVCSICSSERLTVHCFLPRGR